MTRSLTPTLLACSLMLAAHSSTPLLASSGRPGGAMPGLGRTVEPECRRARSDRAVGDEDRAAAARIASRMIAAPSLKARDRHFDDLVKRAVDSAGAREALASGIVELEEGAVRRMNSVTARRSFAELLETRERLDVLRTETLALIRDEVAYPYPYQTPAASPEAAARYREAQRRIDRSVAEMKVIWRSNESAPLSRELRRGVERLLWSRRARRRLMAELRLAPPAADVDLPAWMAGLPVELDDRRVTIQTLAIGIQEGDAFAQDRAVMAWNEAQAEALRRAAKKKSMQERLAREIRSLEVTNDYRRMFGLRALAWSPSLYAASRQHSDWMDDRNLLSHDQDSFQFANVHRRCAHFGYPGDVRENCHHGSGTAPEALLAWIRSSAHHRTLLNPTLTESATGFTDSWWTQNFGLDRGFESKIQCHPWRD